MTKKEGLVRKGVQKKKKKTTTTTELSKLTRRAGYDGGSQNPAT